MKVLLKSLTSTSYYLLLIIVCQNPPYLCHCPPRDAGHFAKIHHILCQCPPRYIGVCFSDFLKSFQIYFAGHDFHPWQNREESFPLGKILALSSVVLTSGCERVRGQRRNDPVEAPRRSLVN